MNLIEKLNQTQAAASLITSGRVSDLRLYSVLASALAACEQCIDPVEEALLRRSFKALPVTGTQNRQYVNKSSDVSSLVCRYIFIGDILANASRYAHALREAQKLQIRSDDLVEWLKDNGGVNALYLRRPVARKDVRTKCLRLTTQIVVPKGRAFILTLLRTEENSYEVLQHPLTMRNV